MWFFKKKKNKEKQIKDYKDGFSLGEKDCKAGLPSRFSDKTSQFSMGYMSGYAYQQEAKIFRVRKKAYTEGFNLGSSDCKKKISLRFKLETSLFSKGYLDGYYFTEAGLIIDDEMEDFLIDE